MCGIVGALGNENVVPVLMEGLKRLEYRGYDSAGLALLTEAGLSRCRVVGKVANLDEAIQKSPMSGLVGIAHTRWATHGRPSEWNAHPHWGQHQRIAIVHNGIIENYQSLKAELLAKGLVFQSETDSEVLAMAIEYELGDRQGEQALLDAVQATVAKLKGAYAICVVDALQPDLLLALRSSSPLVLGLAEAAQFVASDPLALGKVCSRFIYLEEGDLAVIKRQGLSLYDRAGMLVDRPVTVIEQQAVDLDKQAYAHYMQKEIHEQADVVRRMLSQYFSGTELNLSVFGDKAPALLQAAQKIHIVACGTSYFAGLVAKYWLEMYGNLPCEVEIASEFRYRVKVIPEKTVFLAISQSGETADTLAAIRSVRSDPHCLGILAMVNVPNSSLLREADAGLLTLAGPEIGVCSTKAFTAQLMGLLLLALCLRDPNKLPPAHEALIRQGLVDLPASIERILGMESQVAQVAQQLKDQTSILFLGRGLHFPVAMEGALKLKEISYIYAEAYAGGELKHGPLALVDDKMAVVVVGSQEPLFEKLRSNIEEVRARGGHIFAFLDERLGGLSGDVQITALPAILPALSPILYVIPLQMLAYHLAVLKGSNVDQPRNLAKSVTVE